MAPARKPARKPASSSRRKDSAGPPPATARPDPAQRRRAQTLYRRLVRCYPQARCALHHHDAWQLLVATILSAQCTDQRVNQVTPALFDKYPDPHAMARAKPAELEALIRSTGFYRNKARSLIGAAQALCKNHRGQVPADMQQLLALPGVARKTANVVLGNAFGINAGIVVDTHVKRLARRLGLTTHTDPVKIEQDLMALFPTGQWTQLAHLLIWHGRGPCQARKTDCDNCCLADLCPRIGIDR